MATILERYRATIIGECVSALRQHPDLPVEGEDIVQDVMVEIITNMERVAAASEPRAYIRRCARTAAARAIRAALQIPPTMPYPVVVR